MTLGLLSALAHLRVIWLLFTVARLVADAITHLRDMRACTLDAQLELTNLSRRDSMLLRTTLQLRYGTTPDQLRLVLVRSCELLIQHPRVLPDPVRVRFVGYGSSSLDVEIFAYVATQDRNESFAIQEDVMLRIEDIVEDAGFELARRKPAAFSRS